MDVAYISALPYHEKEEEIKPRSTRETKRMRRNIQTGTKALIDIMIRIRSNNISRSQ